MASGERATWSVPQRDATAPRDDPTKANVLLGVTGSVAAIKTKILYEGLQERYNVRIVATESALNFLETIDGFDSAMVFRDRDEWDSWRGIGDAVLHIELRKWASAFLIAPMSANTLAKVSNGICDNLLTSIVRAWDHARPLILAPAMNTLMWGQPVDAEAARSVRRAHGIACEYRPRRSRRIWRVATSALGPWQSRLPSWRTSNRWWIDPSSVSLF